MSKKIIENIVIFSKYDLDETDGFGCEIDFNKYNSLTKVDKMKLCAELHCIANDLLDKIIEDTTNEK